MCGARYHDFDRSRAFDHVIVRQHLSRRGEHDARARRSAALVTELRVDDDDPGSDRRWAAARECQSRADSECRHGDDRGEDQSRAKAAEHLDATSAGRACGVRDALVSEGLCRHGAPCSAFARRVYVRCARQS